MPVVFVGHGSPMNALEDNEYTRAWHALAQSIPTPRAVLCVSAHWHVPGVGLTADAFPKTIHDFGGFPPALHAVQYPAPGSEKLVQRSAQLLAAQKPRARTDWGLDHGAWSVLVRMYPAANIPVVQLSMPRSFSPEEHLQLGVALRPLRDEGVLVLCSGNVTHNLRHAFSAPNAPTPAWAQSFDASCAAALEHHDHKTLVQVLSTPEGRMAHPTEEHFLPLLYAAGAATPSDAVSFPCTGFVASSLSMRSVRLG